MTRWHQTVSTVTSFSEAVDDDHLVHERHVPDWELRYRRFYPVKRAIDLALLVPGALLALPVLIVAALAVMIVSPGNPFYGQTRVGLYGRRFRVWKLRTMRRDAESRLEEHLATNERARAEWQTHFKLTRDPRILPGVGPLLRRTSLDELPQLWNILRGQMSFVGPRPFPPYHLEAFDEGFRALRARVVPGLTGLWQISARADGDLAVQKALDGRYVRQWSPMLDFRITLRTPWSVLIGKGAR